MGPPTDRKQILESFRKQIKDGKPIVGAGAGLYGPLFPSEMDTLTILLRYRLEREIY